MTSTRKRGKLTGLEFNLARNGPMKDQINGLISIQDTWVFQVSGWTNIKYPFYEFNQTTVMFRSSRIILVLHFWTGIIIHMNRDIILSDHMSLPVRLWSRDNQAIYSQRLETSTCQDYSQIINIIMTSSPLLSHLCSKIEHSSARLYKKYFDQ